jgi:hypothetical protein
VVSVRGAHLPLTPIIYPVSVRLATD